MTEGTKSLLAVLGIFVTVALSIVLIGAANKVRQSQVVGGAPCPKVGTQEPTPAKPKPEREQSEEEAFARPMLEVQDPTDADYAYFGFKRAGREYTIFDGDHNIMFRFFVEPCKCPKNCQTCIDKGRYDKTRCDHGGCQCKLPENLPHPPTAAPPESPSTGQLAQPPSASKASQPAACPALVKQPCGGRRLFRRACR